jgi:hypothetical protein
MPKVQQKPIWKQKWKQKTPAERMDFQRKLINWAMDGLNQMEFKMKISILNDKERKEIIESLVAESLNYKENRPGLDTEISLRYYYSVMSDEALYIKYYEAPAKKEIKA